MQWTDARKSAAEYFGETSLVRGLTADSVLNLSPDSKSLYLGPIDWTWGSDDDEIANKLDSVKTQYVLRCNQVELLIHEAGTLIERALGDVLKYDELNLERFKVLVEFCEYDKTQSQQLTEQADNDYWNGLVNEENLASQARTHSIDNATGVDAAYQNAIARYNEAAGDAGRDGAAGDVARQNAAAGSASTAAARLQYQAQVTSSKLDSDSHTARMRYEARARVHQVARQAITQQIIAIKLNEMQRPGGALNYNDRMREIGERALNDFYEVNARLNAIIIGLREFYSVTDPSESELDSDLKTARTRVEGALKWLRKASNSMARARMDEQECVVRLTIEPEGTGPLLDDLKRGRIVQFTSDLVADMKGAQLRGISATAEALGGDSWIDLEVASPEQALSSASITLPSVACRLGRVSSSTSLNLRDIAGGRPIINRTPIGSWTVRATRENGGEPVSRLHLDFHLAFCSV